MNRMSCCFNLLSVICIVVFEVSWGRIVDGDSLLLQIASSLSDLHGVDTNETISVTSK